MKSLTLIILFHLKLVLLLAQKPNSIYSQFKFRNITNEKGLSNNKVNAVCGDNKGFMWFGTNEGVNRFDGYKTIIYKNDPGNSKSISHSVIRSIFADSKNNIWIGTQNGLNLFDEIHNCFIRINDLNNQSLGLIWVVYEDKRGVIWINFANQKSIFFGSYKYS